MTVFQDLRILIALNALVVFYIIVLSYFLWRALAHYRRLVGKTKGADLKLILEKQLYKLEIVKSDVGEVKKRLNSVELQLPTHIQRTGLVRFNPYQELGGDQSFALALLDRDGSGIIISALHSRTSSRIYAKPVTNGKEGKYKLSNEEKEAVKKALQK